MSPDVLMAILLIAAAALFGGTLGIFIRYGSDRAPVVGALIGSFGMIVLIMTQVVSLHIDEETTGMDYQVSQQDVEDPS